jgi:cell cycle sensor histidine kinase DivJ
VKVLSIIRDCLDALLHPSARYDALTRARHRAFMAPRLLGSLAAFAAFPIYLATRGAPTALEVAAFAWLIAPILLSWFLSRTGRYEGAHVLSSLALTGPRSGLSSFRLRRPFRHRGAWSRSPPRWR